MPQIYEGKQMRSIGIVGAAGYSGVELIKLLLAHPEVEIVGLYGQSSAGHRIEEVHPSLGKMISMEIEKLNGDSLGDIDLVFTALPSGQSFDAVSLAHSRGIKVIDLGGDFRLKDLLEYKQYYKHDHTAQDLLEKAVYGLSEWNEDAIASASIVSNPGCYPTSVLLPLIPLLKKNVIRGDFLSIVSYSGTSGAGKSVIQNMIFSEVNESVRAYKVGTHQHIPEIRLYLEKFSGREGIFSFVPHLLPVTRGIYTTIHAKLQDGIGEESVAEAFSSVYGGSRFIRLLTPGIPEMKDVLYTNFCDISFKLTQNNMLVVFSTLDNLVKGAAGQAIQNMNIMFGLPQSTGLLASKKKADRK
jgi:N-acetyl-gamma-glutamyl-phosphate reductase